MWIFSTRNTEEFLWLEGPKWKSTRKTHFFICLVGYTAMSDGGETRFICLTDIYFFLAEAINISVTGCFSLYEAIWSVLSFIKPWAVSQGWQSIFQDQGDFKRSTGWRSCHSVHGSCRVRAHGGANSQSHQWSLQSWPNNQRHFILERFPLYHEGYNGHLITSLWESETPISTLRCKSSHFWEADKLTPGLAPTDTYSPDRAHWRQCVAETQADCPTVLLCSLRLR